MSKYIMALDAGTTSNRCILFNEKGEMCSIAQREFKQYFPQPGWVEHDAEDIFESQLFCAREALRSSGLSPTEIAAIGITNQRETTIVWNKHTGRPVYHAIVWQCRRTAAYCDQLKEDGLVDSIRSKTFTVVGRIASPLYLDMNRGTTAVGSGSLENYYYLPAEAFDVDYCTEIHLTLTETFDIFTDAYHNYLEDTLDALEADAELVDLIAYDITIYDKDGNEIVPDETIQVSIVGASLENGDAASVYHIEDSGVAKKVTDVEDSAQASFKPAGVVE